jgi:hypothetical protein
MRDMKMTAKRAVECKKCRLNKVILLVPGEGIEPPTNGLQKRRPRPTAANPAQHFWGESPVNS